MNRFTVRALALTTTTAGLAGLVAATGAPAYADTTALTTPAPTTTAAPDFCTGALPAYVEGKPAGLHARGAAGAYIWHDGDGWHVRVTHRNAKRMEFTGVVRASAPISAVKVLDEKHDVVKTSNGGKTLVFRLDNHGRLDGFDFRDQCAARTAIDLRVNGKQAGRNLWFIGAHDSRPAHNPWVVRRAA